MPFVNIRIVKEVLGEDAAQIKQSITNQVTDAISGSVGIDKDAIWVVFEEVPETEWYVGAQTVKKIRGG